MQNCSEVEWHQLIDCHWHVMTRSATEPIQILRHASLLEGVVRKSYDLYNWMRLSASEAF